jgi:hypothetical protein
VLNSNISSKKLTINGNCYIIVGVTNDLFVWRIIMKKKTLAALLTLTVAFSLSACGSSTTTSDTDTAVEESQAVQDALETVQSEQEAVQEAVQNAQDDSNDPIVEYESPLGYTIEYNSDMFTLESTDVSDTFTYSGDQLEPEAPIYVAIDLHTDMDAETTAKGIALQSGQDGVEAIESTFGNDNEGYVVSYSYEAEGITRNIMSFVVPKDDGCLVMEAGDYTGYDDMEIDGNIEIIIDSFKPVE